MQFENLLVCLLAFFSVSLAVLPDSFSLKAMFLNGTEAGCISGNGTFHTNTQDCPTFTSHSIDGALNDSTRIQCNGWCITSTGVLNCTDMKGDDIYLFNMDVDNTLAVNKNVNNTDKNAFSIDEIPPSNAIELQTFLGSMGRVDIRIWVDTGSSD